MKIVIYFTYTGHTKMIAEKIREKLGCEYSRNGKIQSKHLKSAFIVTAWNNDEMVMSGIDKHIDILKRAIEDNYEYYDWNDKYDLGEVIVELIEQMGEIV